MTGFGRAQRDVDGTTLVVEARSVNHKGLDVKVRLPRPHGEIEESIGKRARKACERGRVDIQVDVMRSATARVDDSQLVALAQHALALAQRVGARAELTAGDLLRASLATPRNDVDPLREPPIAAAVLAAVDEALAALSASREAEGQGLWRTLGAHLDTIEGLQRALLEQTRATPARQRERLMGRITALGIELDSQRLAQEVALQAERVDVTEELSRLGLHIARFRELSAQRASGRALDFLCQELLREANTTGSKCQDADAAHQVVQLKAEIERTREQVQNVE